MRKIKMGWNKELEVELIKLTPILNAERLAE